MFRFCSVHKILFKRFIGIWGTSRFQITNIASGVVDDGPSSHSERMTVVIAVIRSIGHYREADYIPEFILNLHRLVNDYILSIEHIRNMKLSERELEFRGNKIHANFIDVNNLESEINNNKKLR